MITVEDRTYTQEELEKFKIYTYDYELNLEPGVFLAKFELRATSKANNNLRVFFTFEDGRKIIAVTKWFQQYLGFYEIHIGSKVRLLYKPNSKGEVYLSEAEVVA